MAVKREPPKNIVILGGGTAGWMAANWLLHNWSAFKVNVTLIESAEIGIIGVGEGSTPYMRNFFRDLGIAESEWMPACNATYKSGISFPGWADLPDNKNYFHPFFTHLDVHHGQAFFDNANLRRQGKTVSAHPNDYFVAAALARAHLAPIPMRSLEYEPDYAYHFDSALLGNFLRTRAQKSGVRHVIDTVAHVEQTAQGDIASLHTKTHGVIDGDFFIDCTGFAGVLIDKTLREDFISFKNNLFNDAAIAIPTPLDDSAPIPVETISGALKNGWAWRIPLTSRFGNGYVYSSDFTTAEEAEIELRHHLGADAEGQQARHLKMRVGRVNNHWRKNCLALGLSQGFIEPLEATALMLVQFTIEKFVAVYTQADSLERARTEVNQKINTMFDGVRDYIVGHYHLNSRTDTDYWIENREHRQLPDNLQTILAAWDGTEDFDSVLRELQGAQVYSRPSWYCLLAGMGRFANKTEVSEASRVDAMRARNYSDSTAKKLFPTHRQHLQKIYGSTGGNQ